jgi:flavin reductase (DIM6/NTAB) family NADH-FMN oxidoreductase RutF
MKQWLGAVRHGKDLRLLPFVYSDISDTPVRVRFCGLSDEPIDVTHDHVPVSLRPLVLGIRLDSLSQRQQDARHRLTLEFHDGIETAGPLASIGLAHAGEIGLSRGGLHLFKTGTCTNRCSPTFTRWMRYALAWQHARLENRKPYGLRMSAGDLICLNAYYIFPRPVFLVSVEYGGRKNIFPMDLVGEISTGEFMLALRTTSPAIELMEGSRQVALSAPPAAQVQAVYALGANHRNLPADWEDLPIPTRESPTFGLPVLAGDALVLELSIREIHRTGSHFLFVGSIVHQSGQTTDQLAHVSGMYAEWLGRRGRALRDVSSLLRSG